MTTVDKDFRVKNGLVVANGGTFGDAVTVGEPALASHAATKEYVDLRAIVVSDTAPSSPINGSQWLDTNVNRVNFYYGGTWYTSATMDDALVIHQHIHDTAIDGSGLVVSTFMDAGTPGDPQGTPAAAGDPTTDVFEDTFDAGTALDNFN
jgi:hypothetical protein